MKRIRILYAIAIVAILFFVGAIGYYVLHPHSYELVEYKEATCTRSGYNTYKCWCGKCRTEMVETLEHDYTVEEIQPTCTHNGNRVYTCYNCGKKYEEIIDPLEHEYEEEVTIEPTCVEEGLMTLKCKNCGETKTEVIAATGHSYIDGVCVNCGEKEPGEPKSRSAIADSGVNTEEIKTDKAAVANVSETTSDKAAVAKVSETTSDKTAVAKVSETTSDKTAVAKVSETTSDKTTVAKNSNTTKRTTAKSSHDNSKADDNAKGNDDPSDYFPYDDGQLGEVTAYELPIVYEVSINDDSYVQNESEPYSDLESGVIAIVESVSW